MKKYILMLGLVACGAENENSSNSPQATEELEKDVTSSITEQENSIHSENLRLLTLKQKLDDKESKSFYKSVNRLGLSHQSSQQAIAKHKTNKSIAPLFLLLEIKEEGKFSDTSAFESSEDKVHAKALALAATQKWQPQNFRSKRILVESLSNDPLYGNLLSDFKYNQASSLKNISQSYKNISFDRNPAGPIGPRNPAGCDGWKDELRRWEGHKNHHIHARDQANASIGSYQKSQSKLVKLKNEAQHSLNMQKKSREKAHDNFQKQKSLADIAEKKQKPLLEYVNYTKTQMKLFLSSDFINDEIINSSEESLIQAAYWLAFKEVSEIIFIASILENINLKAPADTKKTTLKFLKIIMQKGGSVAEKLQGSIHASVETINSLEIDIGKYQSSSQESVRSKNSLFDSISALENKLGHLNAQIKELTQKISSLARHSSNCTSEINKADQHIRSYSERLRRCVNH